jgi:hypothetical protein
MGCVLAIATAAAFCGGSYVAITGHRVGWIAERVINARLAWSALACALAAWGYKVLSHKGLL